MLYTDYEKEQDEKQEKLYYIIQKLLAIGLIISSILPIVLYKDPTFAFLGIPLGLVMLFSKSKIITM